MPCSPRRLCPLILLLCLPGLPADAQPVPVIDPTDLSCVIQEKKIENLPLAGRKWQDLAILVPGAAPGSGDFDGQFDPCKARVGAISVGDSPARDGKPCAVAIACSSEVYLGALVEDATFARIPGAVGILGLGDTNGDDIVGGILMQFSGDVVQEFKVIRELGALAGEAAAPGWQFTQTFHIGSGNGFTLDPKLKVVGAIAVGRRNGDKYDDVILALPDATVAGVPRAGVVLEFLGSSTGLKPKPSRVYRRGLNKLPGKPTANERFGAQVALINFDGKGNDNLFIGCPHCFGKTGAFYAERNDRAFFAQTLGGGNVPSSYFGWAFEAADFNGDRYLDFAVGAPGVDQGAVKNAGAVYVYLGGAAPTYLQAIAAPMALLGQATPLGFGAGLDAFDAVGSGTDQIFAGSPCFDLPTKKDAGGVIPMSLSGAVYTPFHLDRGTIPGDAYPGEFLNIPHGSTALTADKELADLCAGK